MNRAGLSIIEVLMSIGIMAIVLSSLATARMAFFRLDREANAETHALQAANDALERLTLDITQSAATFGDYASCPTVPAGRPSDFCAPDLADLGAPGNVLGNVAIVGPGSSASHRDQGLIDVTINIDEPGELNLATNVSCMDVHPSPTVVDPAPCPVAP